MTTIPTVDVGYDVGLRTRVRKTCTRLIVKPTSEVIPASRTTPIYRPRGFLLVGFVRQQICCSGGRFRTACRGEALLT